MEAGSPIQPDDLLALATVGDVQIAPDGERVAYVLTGIDAAADEYRSAVWVVAVAGGEPVRLTALDGGARPPVWAPDGTRLCFATRVPTDPPPADPAARERWRARPRVVTRASFKVDGAGYRFDTRSHLFIVHVPDGRVTQITRGDAENGTPAWSPDGRRLTESVGRALSPSWSPDGASVTFLAADAGSIHLVRAALADGTVRPVVAGERQVGAPGAAEAGLPGHRLDRVRWRPWPGG